MNWTDYQTSIERGLVAQCKGHRERHRLPTDDVESIECNSECPIAATCPLNWSPQHDFETIYEVVRKLPWAGWDSQGMYYGYHGKREWLVTYDADNMADSVRLLETNQVWTKGAHE